MNFNNFPRFVTFVSTVLLTAQAGYSQDSKDAVILYNTEPVLAHISKSGDVYRIIKDESDFLKGFTLEVPDYEKFLKQKEATKVVSATAASSQNIAIEPPVTGNTIPLPKSNYDILDFSLGGFYFAEGQATLNADAIGILDNVIIYTQANPDKKIHFNLMKDASQGKRLIKNRTNAILTYLKLRGVNIDDITFLEDNNLTSNYTEFYVVK